MDIKELIQTGKDLRDKGKYEEALKIYERILEKCPNYVPALIGKGVTLRGLKEYDEALITLDMAIEADPKSTKAWNNKGYTLRDLKRYEEALKAFKTSLDIHSKFTSNYLGVSYSWDGKELVLHGLKSNNCPEISYSWNGKGLVLRDLKRYEEALKAFKESINICPESAFSWNGKGLVYLSFQKYNEATEAYETALCKEKINNSQKIFAWNGKGIALAYLNKYDEAIEAFEKSIDLNLKQGFPWNGKGLIFLRFNQFDKAIESFKKSIYYDPSFIPSYNNLTMLYLKIGNLEGSISILKDLNDAVKEPNNYLTLFLKGKIEFENMNYNNAIYYFEEAISQNPEDPLILFWKAYAKYLKAEVDFDSSDKRYQNAILSCIRDLEKVSVLSSSNNENEYLSFTEKGEELVERFTKKIKYLSYSFKHRSNIPMGMLANTTSDLLKYKNPRIEANINYFLGCCYYKLDDYILVVYFHWVDII